MLLDSNIIIYAAKPEHVELRRFIALNAPAVSAISYVEVLGYHRLTEAERQHFNASFVAAIVLPISEAVLDEAIALRQCKKMSLGDSLIAGTALAFHRTLVTRNIVDFAWIPDLTLLNPFEAQVS